MIRSTLSIVSSLALGAALLFPQFSQASGTVTAEYAVKINNQLSTDYLYEFPTKASAASDSPASDLVVAHYSLEEGLFAGFEATDGTRLVLKSQKGISGHVSLRVMYLDRKTGLPTPAVTMASPAAGKPASLYVGGVDIFDLMSKKDTHPGFSSDEERRLNNFLRSKVGQALLELVPVVYVKLEQFESVSNSEVAAYKAPLGLIRSAADDYSNL